MNSTVLFDSFVSTLNCFSLTTLTAVQSERKPNSFLGAGDRQDKEESPPITTNPISGFESPTLASSKTPVVGKDIPSQPPTSLAELHLQMAKAFEGAFNMESKETGNSFDIVLELQLFKLCRSVTYFS